MSYVPGNDARDLAALIGGLLAAAIGLGWWVRRGDAQATPDGSAEAGSGEELLDAEGHWLGPEGC